MPDPDLAGCDSTDLAALRRAFELASRDPERREQLQAMLRDGGWLEAAKFASYHCQCRSLSLRPWEHAPCHGGGDPQSGALLDRMRAAGVSQWDPDPLAALAKAEAKAKRRK